MKRRINPSLLGMAMGLAGADLLGGAGDDVLPTKSPPRPGPGAQRARMREADKRILNQDFYRDTPILEVMTRQLARANMRKRAKALMRKLSRDAAAELVKLRAEKRAEAERLFGRVPGPRPIKSDGTFSLRPDHLYANKARRGRQLRAMP